MPKKKRKSEAPRPYCRGIDRFAPSAQAKSLPKHPTTSCQLHFRKHTSRSSTGIIRRFSAKGDKFRITTSKILFIAGIFFLSASILWNLNQTIQLAFFTPKVTPVKNSYSIPTQITINKINLNLNIEETAINNGIWQIAQNGASHLTISARPGEKGPIIIYAHNTNDRFGPIRWLSVGETIKLTTKDGKTHNYKISQTMDVQPDKLSIFTNAKNETLILYTCDGFADLQRFVLLAKPTTSSRYLPAGRQGR